MPNRPKDKAIKILSQYERLANKHGLNLSEEKIKQLNDLREQGLIKISHLPAKLRAEFSWEFSDMNLNDIRAFEE
ncbi:MAG TPA: hypothetical protein VK184_02275 [Nostocaceae cyanobacterium]|nr:hypothetical protein [Nostocaceae cyanobacterium]